MSRLDLAFYSRPTAKDPIVLKDVRGIEHEAKWGRWRSALFIAAVTGFLWLVIVACIVGFLT